MKKQTKWQKKPQGYKEMNVVKITSLDGLVSQNVAMIGKENLEDACDETGGQSPCPFLQPLFFEKKV